MITILATLACVAIVVLWGLSLYVWMLLHFDDHEQPEFAIGFLLVTLFWAGAFILSVLWGVNYS